MDFLIKAYFWMSPDSPGTHYYYPCRFSTNLPLHWNKNNSMLWQKSFPHLLKISIMVSCWILIRYFEVQMYRFPNIRLNTSERLNLQVTFTYLSQTYKKCIQKFRWNSKVNLDCVRVMLLFKTFTVLIWFIYFLTHISGYNR